MDWIMENRTTVFEVTQYISMHEALNPEFFRHYYLEEFNMDELDLNVQQRSSSPIVPLLA